MIAILSKREADVTREAITMLKVLEHANPKRFTFVSPNTIAIKGSLDALFNQDTKSSVIVGSATPSTIKHVYSHPLRIENAVFVLNGRINADFNAKIEWEAMTKLKQHGEKHKDFALRFLKETDGEFAFVIAETGAFIAGRDAMGVHPLYYGENADFVALASERKALWKINIETTHSFPPGHIATTNRNGFRFVSVKGLKRVRTKHITMRIASKRLEDLLRHSIGRLVSDLKKVAVAFSGGLDSGIVAFLASNLPVDVHLLHVGLRNQAEMNYAKRVAEELKLPIHFSMYTEDDVEAVLPKVLWLIEDPNPVKASVGIPFYWVAEKAVDMGFGVVLSGQGADELFGGYKKYVDCYFQHGCEIVEDMIFEDIKKAHRYNFDRDYKIFNYHGVENRLPFASHRIAKFALTLPLDLKIACSNTSPRKLLLRQLAKDIGVPKSIVSRPKRAIQYSTGVNRTLQRLARQRRLSLTKYLRNTFNVMRQRMTELE